MTPNFRFLNPIGWFFHNCYYIENFMFMFFSLCLLTEIYIHKFFLKKSQLKVHMDCLCERKMCHVSLAQTVLSSNYQNELSLTRSQNWNLCIFIILSFNQHSSTSLTDIICYPPYFKYLVSNLLLQKLAHFPHLC